MSEPLSHFQIGGIHGLPYIPWNGVPTPAGGGYCTHGSVIFPTWHRPYMMLYEQELQRHAREIALKYQADQEAWKTAADQIRLPYWDWAVKRENATEDDSAPPAQVLVQREVIITIPDGREIPVPNPLYQYNFKSEHFEGTKWSIWDTTLRQPTTTDENASSDPARVRALLYRDQESTTSKTYTMLTRLGTWEEFSNHADTGGDPVNSLEAIHDGIHYLVGGEGHMGSIAIAGFDHVFYLHHSNVDRLLSLWSALHPNVWVPEGDGGETPPDNNTPLTPFRKEGDAFWASAATTDTTTLGYTYPEFNGLDMGDTEAVRIAIAKKVNELYGNPVFTEVAPPNLGLYDWTARVESKQFEISISYSVLIFLGPVPEDPKEWQLSPNRVGSHYAFVNDAAQKCKNCRENLDLVIEGFVHLNNAIARHPELRSFKPEIIEPYLTKNLHWRALRVDGKPITLDSLEVTVHATPLKYPTGAIFAAPGKSRRYDSITFGRNGGSRHDPKK